MPLSILLARTTMARAFQRTRLLMRRSISWLPGKGGCCRDGNRVLVGSCGGEGKVYAGCAPGVQRKLLQQSSRPLRAALRQNIVQRIQPLPGLKYFHSIGLRLSHVWFSPSMNANLQ